MVGGLMFLVDTNVWLELFLEQARADEVRQFFQEIEAGRLSITEFPLYSIGVILTRLRKDDVFEDFLSDTIEDSGVGRICLDSVDLKRLLAVRRQFQLDFDDAYQYVAAEKYDLTLVSMDADFDRTERGRKTPVAVLPR
jgi:predicted nucleic acid-binding protein